MYLIKSHIRITSIVLLLGIISFKAFSQLNGAVQISGRVVLDNGQSAAFASVWIKGTAQGTTTDSLGHFSILTTLKFPFTIQVSSVGFAAFEWQVSSERSPITIQLATQQYLANEVVVTASRVAEKIMQSPVSIEKLDIRTLKETPAASFYDAIGNAKGVQLLTSSITFKVPNTRGFNIPNNFRFMQLVDGVDMQAATLGVPLGNAIGPTELDIQSIEITPGAASALYGMNAINGMANLLTKNPFTSQGLSFYQRTGINHVDGIDHPPALLTEIAVRYAKAFHNKFAFKINAGYLQGTDWISDSRLDQNPNSSNTANPAYPALNSEQNIAFDGWNKYGDDALAGSNTISINGLTIDGIPNRTLTVTRTGYWEKDLVDPRVDNLKLDASVYYKFNSNIQISYTYRVGKMDGVFQRGNKVKLDNVIIQNHQLELKGKHYTLKAYSSLENSGNSYNVKPLADNMDLYTGGSSSVWSATYKTALTNYASANGGLSGMNLGAANAFARQQADASRALPGTAGFDSLKHIITGINNWDIRSANIPDAPETGGAALLQRSPLYHIEGQWDLSDQVELFNLLLGADIRIYEVIPDGNNFVDFSRPIAVRNKPVEENGKVPDSSNFGQHIYYKKFGGFAQASKSFYNDKLKISASLRADYNPEFTIKFTPRTAVVYRVKEQHYFRLTYQQGYRFPALFEALSYVNNGRVKRVGILPVINEGLGYRENSYTQSSVAAFNAAVKKAGNSDSAAFANSYLLQAANLPDGQPESIRAFEIGYKSAALNNKLIIDMEAYLNVYSGFLGQVQVYVPKGETVGTDAAILAMIDRNRDATVASNGNESSKGQERYRVYSNAVNRHLSYGTSLAITYNFYKTYNVSGNINYNSIKGNSSKDLFVTGFNTPHWTTNISFGNRAVTKHFGFNIVYKWQDCYLWESPLVTGDIKAIHNIDAQITMRITKLISTVKVGGTNIINHRYIQYAGGPTIGAMYYVAVTIDGLYK